MLIERKKDEGKDHRGHEETGNLHLTAALRSGRVQRDENPSTTHSKQRGTQKLISPNCRVILCTETYLSGVVFMARNIAELGPKEAEFLVRMAAEKSGIFTFKEAHAFWRNRAYTTKVLHRLLNKGWLERLTRGTYMVIPLEAGLRREWSEEGLVIAPYLAKRVAVAYWSALHYWHMTEQMPRVIFLQTPERTSQRVRKSLGISFRFVTVREHKFFGIATSSVDGRSVLVTDREKTLVDAADRLDLSGGIAQLAEALRGSWNEIDWKQIDAYLEQFRVGAVVKRLGYLVETMNLPIPKLKERLELWQSHLSAGVSLLEPGSGKEGKIVSKWRLRINSYIPSTRDNR